MCGDNRGRSQRLLPATLSLCQKRHLRLGYGSADTTSDASQELWRRRPLLCGGMRETSESGRSLPLALAKTEQGARSYPPIRSSERSTARNGFLQRTWLRSASEQQRDVPGPRRPAQTWHLGRAGQQASRESDRRPSSDSGQVGSSGWICPSAGYRGTSLCATGRKHSRASLGDGDGAGTLLEPRRVLGPSQGRQQRQQPARQSGGAFSTRQEGRRPSSVLRDISGLGHPSALAANRPSHRSEGLARVVQNTVRSMREASRLSLS